MTYSQLALKTAYYTTALGVVIIGGPIATYVGLKLADSRYDTSYGRAIDEYFNEHIFHRERLQVDSSSKSASNVLYNNTYVHYGKKDDHAVVKDGIYNILQSLEKDPVIKYFTYVNALAAKANEHGLFGLAPSKLNFLNNKSPIIVALWDNIPDHMYARAEGVCVLGFNFIPYGRDFKVSESIVAHEMVHSAYYSVYGNNYEPFAADNSALRSDYESIFKHFEHTTMTFSTACRSEISSASRTVSQYAPELRSMEAVAYYIQFYAEKKGNSCVDKAFPGYKEFIQTHTIPDFIKFIENHPYCNEITYSDETIHCKVSDTDITTLAEL